MGVVSRWSPIPGVPKGTECRAGLISLNTAAAAAVSGEAERAPHGHLWAGDTGRCWGSLGSPSTAAGTAQPSPRGALRQSSAPIPGCPGTAGIHPHWVSGRGGDGFCASYGSGYPELVSVDDWDGQRDTGTAQPEPGSSRRCPGARSLLVGSFCSTVLTEYPSSCCRRGHGGIGSPRQRGGLLRVWDPNRCFEEQFGKSSSEGTDTPDCYLMNSGEDDQALVLIHPLAENIVFLTQPSLTYGCCFQPTPSSLSLTSSNAEHMLRGVRLSRGPPLGQRGGG